MQQQIFFINFKQKSDDGCTDETEIQCQYCGRTIKEKDIIMFAGYEICPFCQVNCKII
jgi:hypothetical protein